MYHYRTFLTDSGEQGFAGSFPDPAVKRLLAAMGGYEGFRSRPRPFEKTRPSARFTASVPIHPESDSAYFLRRSREERRAADTAAGSEARAAHSELADLYERHSEALTRLLRSSSDANATAVRSAVVGAERQDALLDEALKQTFPASDPVSVVFV